MSIPLTPIKEFLGLRYDELFESTKQPKYKDTNLEAFFEHRFHVHRSKPNITVDQSMVGLSVIIAGNETVISKALYEHPNVLIRNIIDGTDMDKKLYYPEMFSSVAYLLSNNQNVFHINGDVDEPIYVRYVSEYESIYNAVAIFNVVPNLDIEVVEEIEGKGAFNSVMSYIIRENSKLRLSTYYKNNKSAISLVYRSVIIQDDSKFEHDLFSKGSYISVDETKAYTNYNSSCELYGCVYSDKKQFRSIATIVPTSSFYDVNVDYRHIVYNGDNITFYPTILGEHQSHKETIRVTEMNLNEIGIADLDKEVTNYLKDLIDRSTLDRILGSKRFYDNQAKFLKLP